MNATPPRPLAGCGIVITRPAQHAVRFAELVRSAGGHAILFPAIEIVAASHPQAVNELIDRLEQFDLAIFISPNAVQHGLALIQARRALPRQLKIAAIGSGTVRELERAGASGVIAPQRFDSEALLEMPALRDVAGKRVVIFRGEGGRELLGDTLAARGATVEHAECYRRRRPQLDPVPLLDAWARGEVHAVAVTSSEGLRNFCELVGEQGRARLAATPLFVPHPRIERSARDLGLAKVVLTAQGDEGLLQGMVEWFARRR